MAASFSQSRLVPRRAGEPRYLVQIADGPLFISLLQKTPDRRQVIPQIVAETAHLGLLLPEALIVDLPQTCQAICLLQPLVIRQNQNGEQQDQRGQKYKGRTTMPWYIATVLTSIESYRPEGQQHHGNQGAQGHGR